MFSELKSTSVTFLRTFNPADYTSEAGTGATQPEGWDTAANNSSDGTGESFASLCHM